MACAGCGPSLAAAYEVDTWLSPPCSKGLMRNALPQVAGELRFLKVRDCKMSEHKPEQILIEDNMRCEHAQTGTRHAPRHRR